jgi:hypothetical protein
MRSLLFFAAAGFSMGQIHLTGPDPDAQLKANHIGFL